MLKTLVGIGFVLSVTLCGLSSCGPSIESVNTADPGRIPTITGETHAERVRSQQQIMDEQERERERQREEIKHYERQQYYNELMRKKAGME